MKRKAQIFNAVVLIFTFLALTWLFIGVSYKYNGKEVADTRLYPGSASKAILNAYQTQEEGMIYLDEAARISLINSIIKLNEHGGINENSECGNAGYNIWNIKNKKCVPDYETSLKEIYSEELKRNIHNYQKYTFSEEYKINLKQENNKVEIIGKTIDKIKVSVSLTGDIAEQQTNIYSGGIPASVKENVNQYNELIFEASTEFKIEPAILKAVITQESAGDKNAISPTGCAGIMQFCTSTAEKYFSQADILNLKSLSACAEKASCTPSDYAGDPRFNPEKAIPAGANLIKNLLNHHSIEDLSDKKAFAVAAYNGGIGVIEEAIEKTGKENPSWQEASRKIAPELLALYPPYNSWEEEELVAKVKEIRNYVDSLKSLYMEWGGTEMFTPTTIGTFEFGQNFRTKINYDLTVYDELEEFSSETINECKDKVEECLENKITEFNNARKENEAEVVEVKSNIIKILPMSECEEGTEKLYYDFVENLQDCTHAWSNNCKCQITESYSEEEIEKINYNFNQIRFDEKETEDEKKRTFNVSLTRPTELVSDFSIDQKDILMMQVYKFKYNDELENEKLIFESSTDRRIITDDLNFNNIFLVRKNNKFEFMLEEKETLLEQIGWTISNLGEEIFPLTEENNKEEMMLINPSNPEQKENIPRECPVARQTFRLCAVTKNMLPELKENPDKIGSFDLEYKNSKVKFALTLADETSPKQIQNLDVELTNEVIGTGAAFLGLDIEDGITLTWIDKNASDLVYYDISVDSLKNPLPGPLRPTIGQFYLSEAIKGISPTEENVLFFEPIGNDMIKYIIEISSDKVNLESEQTYAVEVFSVDNFQNQAKPVQFDLIMP
ncbi:lytic transglycosylase domain-containing protein [Bacteroidota bacterium]